MSSSTRAGSSATKPAVLTDPWPLPMIRRSAARSTNEGSVMSGPAVEPIWIQCSGRPRSARSQLSLLASTVLAGHPAI
jgi:hypothetical protein